MDRHLPPHPQERQFINHHAPPPPQSSYPPPFHMQQQQQQRQQHAQTAQPPTQIPFSDPFPQGRDPFLPGSHGRRGSVGLGGRGWPPAQGNGVAPSNNPPPLPHPSHPPPPQHMHGQMSMAYEPSRRRSLGGAGSPQQYAPGPLEPPAAPPSFPARHMPPPSPPQMHPGSSTPSMLGSAPRGPPTSSPFAGIRDLASLSSSHRPAAGMSISSILGGGEEPRRPAGSPHGSAAAPRGMQPPSPGRARSSSMREGYNRGGREHSPDRLAALGEPRPASAALGHDRFPPEARRDGMFRSPQPQPPQRESAHSFRAFRAPPPDQSPQMNVIAQGRPSSQPAEPGPTRSLDDMMRRDDPAGGRLGVFRAFGDGPPRPRGETMPRHDTAPFQHSMAPTSQPAERHVFDSPASNKEVREQMQPRFQPAPFGTPMREDQTGLFRPAIQPQPHPQTVLEQAREPLESRSYQDMRRDMQRSSPPANDIAHFGYRNTSHERPLTFEEHQRMEAYNREQQQRKESDGSVHRALRNISPEMNRLGRNSPLPQAVQGAQPRHVRPGEDHPGIKSEFGRMFSGLGSGVGSTTPTAGHSANGISTPSRLSPSRQVESGDLVRTAVAEIEEGRGASKSARGARKTNRRPRAADDNPTEAEVYDGRMTPSLSQQHRGSKRARTAHHHHHHAHHHFHHHEAPENAAAGQGQQRSPFNMLRFPSNPLAAHVGAPHVPGAAGHHHHHHHGAHAHPGHHHHHAPPRAAAAASVAGASSLPARKPSLKIENRALLESVKDLPRRHLGSHVYASSIGMAPPGSVGLPYASTATPLPKYEGAEGCTVTVRVPRWVLARSSAAAASDGNTNGNTNGNVNGGGKDDTNGVAFSPLEEICRRRDVFGTDVYTDDSDPVAAAVHAGWLRGDFGEWTADLAGLESDDDEDDAANADAGADVLSRKPGKPLVPPHGQDAHITLLLLPTLSSYTSTLRHNLLSRPWSGATLHDGLSFAIADVQFVDEAGSAMGARVGCVERGGKARKARLAEEMRGRAEEGRRVEAALGLVGLVGGGVGKKASVIGAGISGGGRGVGVGA